MNSLYIASGNTLPTIPPAGILTVRILQQRIRKRWMRGAVKPRFYAGKGRPAGRPYRTRGPPHKSQWRPLMPSNPTYDMLLNLVKTRMSVRKFRPDPIPEDTIDKILEVARWAMSGANSQPWEFVVVTDPEIKKQLRDAYSEHNTDYIFWMEQQREYNRSEEH